MAGPEEAPTASRGRGLHRQGRSSPVEDRGRLFQERGQGGGRILDIAGPAAASDRAALTPGCGGEGDEAGQRRNLANGQ